ncbi:MAG TPA: TMEM175 family protein [Roseiarcus sp.]|nr:TMEM175 family protein [Roseiarcus sp.]
MGDAYNRIAAGDVGRIAALSDGVFAVAVTLLVLDIHAPEAADIHSERALLAALVGLAPRWLAWGLSVMTLGIFWVGQQTQLNQLERADRDFTWASYLFLASISALPFSTRVLADFFEFRTAVALYWANILLCGLTIYLTWALAAGRKLVRADCPPETDRAIRRRIVIAQSLYFLGGLIGLVHTLIGVAFIILVQLNYAVAPVRRWVGKSAGADGQASGD